MPAGIATRAASPASARRLRRSSPGLNLYWGPYPGQVWTLIAWSLLSGLNLLFASTIPPNSNPANAVTVGSCLYSLLVVILLLTTGARAPRWLPLVLLGGAVASTTMQVQVASTPLDRAVWALPYIVYCSYAALWWPRRVALLFLAFIAVGYFVVLVHSGAMPSMLVTWLMVMSICTGLVLLLGYLVTHLLSIATIDPLTGLLNRTGLMTLLGLMPNSGRGILPRTVIVIDLDDLKKVNDTQGHRAGDRVLHDFGQALRRTARADDVVARTGGDEFVVLLPATTLEQAHVFVQRLTASTDISWSSGISAWGVDMTFDEAISRADVRMYQAKRDRRGA